MSLANYHINFYCLKNILISAIMDSLDNGISTFVGYLIPEPFFLKNISGFNWEDKGVYTFPKGICPKVNVMVQLEYKLATYDSAVQRINRYTTRIPPVRYWVRQIVIPTFIAKKYTDQWYKAETEFNSLP